MIYLYATHIVPMIESTDNIGIISSIIKINLHVTLINIINLQNSFLNTDSNKN